MPPKGAKGKDAGKAGKAAPAKKKEGGGGGKAKKKVIISLYFFSDSWRTLYM